MFIKLKLLNGNEELVNLNNVLRIVQRNEGVTIFFNVPIGTPELPMIYNANYENSMTQIKAYISMNSDKEE